MSSVVESVSQPKPLSRLVESVEKQQQRNIAVDAYRGFVMLLMMGEVLQFSRVAQSFPGNHIWQFLAFNQTHVEWAGMSLHDNIQPGFHLSRRRCSSLFAVEPPAEGRKLQAHARPHHLAQSCAGVPGILSSLHV